jgi:hypothetical protein
MIEPVIPDDATGDAIRRFLSGGIPYGQIRDLEFVLLTETPIDLNPYKSVLISKGAQGFKNVKRDDGKIDVYISVKIPLNYEAIVELESHLSKIADSTECIYDGWGGFE